MPARAVPAAAPEPCRVVAMTAAAPDPCSVADMPAAAGALLGHARDRRCRAGALQGRAGISTLSLAQPVSPSTRTRQGATPHSGMAVQGNKGGWNRPPRRSSTTPAPSRSSLTLPSQA